MQIFKSLFTFLIVFLFGALSAQSINKSFKKFHILRMEGDLSNAFKLLTEIEKRALIKNPEILPRIYTEYTKFYFSAENFPKAKEYSDKAYELGLVSTLPEYKAYGLFARAYYYYQLDLDETAAIYAKQSASIVENQLSSAHKLAGDLYYLLYRINSHRDDFELTNKYAEKTIVIAKASNDYELLANALSAKATAMGFGFDKFNKQVYNDSVKIYLEESLNLFVTHSKEITERTYAIANINLANVYLKEFSQNRSIESKYKTLFYLDKVDQLNKIADFNYELRANVLGIRSQIALEEKQFDQAEFYLRAALSKLSHESKRPAYYTLFNIVNGLEELYKETGDYKNALYFADQKLHYQKKMFDESTAGNIRSLEAKFENEKIANQLKVSEDKSEQRKVQNYMLTAILALLCTTVYFTLRNYRNRINLQKKKIESADKEKLRALAELNLENEARKSLHAEQKILKLEHEKSQKEALVHALLIDQKNQLLKDIGEQIKYEPGQQNLQNILKQDARNELQVTEKANEFDKINPLFFERIQQIYGDKLTARDVKLCAYLFLGLSNKEVSIIFNVEPKSVRMSKYRIKKKLELGTDVILEEELKSIMDRL